MPICRDPELVRPLLLTDEPGTRSIYNLVFGLAGARAKWIRLDDLNNPHAVIIRSGAPYRSKRHYIYANRNQAVRNLLAELPRGWKLAFAGSPLRLARVVGESRKLVRIHANYLYVLNPEKLVVDRTHAVGHLRPEDAAVIARFWADGRQLRYVRWRISAGPTCAIRRNGRLVAWATTHAEGSMGMLRVLDDYRGQGMARTITYVLARRVMQAGLKPFLHINRKNHASISLTESMGFERHAVYAWFSE